MACASWGRKTRRQRLRGGHRPPPPTRQRPLAGAAETVHTAQAVVKIPPPRPRSTSASCCPQPSPGPGDPRSQAGSVFAVGELG